MTQFVECQPRIAIAPVKAPVGGPRPGQPMEFLLGGKPVRIELDCQGRMVARCSRCTRLCRTLFFPEIICRKCAGLVWASSWRSPLALATRIQRWRSSIHQDPMLFSPLVRRPHGRQRVQRVMRTIMRAESELLNLMRQRTDALLAKASIAGQRKRKPAKSAASP